MRVCESNVRTGLIGHVVRDLTSMQTSQTQYCAGDKIEKNEMGWACGAYG